MKSARRFFENCLRLVAGVLFPVFVAGSCSKDPLAAGPDGGGIVRFGVTHGEAWQTRSAASADTTLRCAVYPLEGTSQGDTLYLHATVSEREVAAATTETAAGTAATRGTCVDEATFYDAFGVLAYVYTDSWSDALTPDYMYDVEVTKASGWTASDYNWPGRGRKIRFFAYAPYRAAGVVLSGKTTPGIPTLTCTTPTDVAQQQDLMTAAPAEMDGAPAPDKSAALSFRHILTAVRFLTGDDLMAGRITKISLKGVYGKAVYDLGTDQWGDFAGTGNFSQSLSKDLDGTPDEEITAADATFLMIPQTLPQGATIEVAYTDKLTGTSRTLTAQIGGSKWPAGRLVTYRISTSSITITPTFTITAPEDFTYTGGTKSYKVDSRGVVTRPGDPQKSVPLPWTAEFVEDDGAGGYRVIEKPEWITDFTMSGNGGTAAQSFNVTIAAQTGYNEPNPHNDILRQAAPVSGTYDLSTQGGTKAMSTANCYVINAPGKYTLPLVYGNAIKDGQTNESAYISSAPAAETILSPFINHLGAGITDPYIYNNAGCVPDNATLVWQDRFDMVTNVTLSDDKRSLTFEVKQTTIGQGNAVVAVRDASNTILWSWHIWVTDFVPGLEPTVEMTYDPSKTQRDKIVTNYQNVKYTFMGVAIGWCDGETTTYEGRSVKVRFTQAETKETQIIEVVQTRYSSAIGGNVPYYQWGRKDPMLPSTGNDNINKTWYDGDGNPSTTFTTASWPKDRSTIIDGILNPEVFCINGTMDNYYYNLWSIDNTRDITKYDNPVLKTIYDPSPVGYYTPPLNIFTGFTYDGDDVSGNKNLGYQFNSPYTSSNDFSDNGGWIFYCNKMKGIGQFDDVGGIIFFPALGYRNTNTGNVEYVGSGVYYWIAIPATAGSGYYLSSLNSTVRPKYTNNRSIGFPIRPVRE